MMRHSKIHLSLYTVAVGAVVSLCTFFLFLKLKLFFGLAYTSDLFIHTQKSRSFLYGFPLLYDNFHGPHPYHNTFLELALSPLSALYGSVGLIFGYWLFFTSMFLWMAYEARSRSAATQVWLFSFVFFSLLGPIGFWTFDNPVYGWHPEMLALPCGLGLALSLIRDSKWSTVFFSVGCVLTHEMGAVLACAIHLLWYHIIEMPRNPFRFLVAKRHIQIVGPWLIVFVFGLAIQRYWDPTGAGRLSGVLDSLQTPGGIANVTHVALPLLGLLGLTSLVFIVLIGSIRGALFTLLCASPLIAAGAAAGLAYGAAEGAEMHNIFWPPRWSFVWAVTSAGFLFTLLRCPSLTTSHPKWIIAILPILGVLIFAQDQWLLRVRGYNTLERVHMASHDYLLPLFSKNERALLECIRENTSHRTRILLPGSLLATFYTHDLDHENPHNPFRSDLSIIICDKQTRTPFDYDCLGKQLPYLTRPSYIRRDFQGLQLVLRDRFQGVYKTCRKYAR